MNYLPILIVITIHFIQTPSYAQKNPNCKPSACGNIHDIHYPFRLKDDPDYCGHDSRNYEISCENNTSPSVYIHGYRYNVRAINYGNYTIRLADPSIGKNDSCSFPTNSTRWAGLVYYPSPGYNVSLNYPYSSGELHRGIVWTVTFMACPSRPNVGANQLYCSSITHIKAGYMDPDDHSWDMCRIEFVVITSLPFINSEDNYISLSEGHQSLAYGFELSWSFALCDCHPWEDCVFDRFMSTICESRTCNYSYHDVGRVSYFVLRVLLGMPFLLGFVIYKLRRRHLSMFHLIEEFLQSHNNLMPIRYSYTDIKNMTKGFQEKLGQGGYGSVYMGKLRSGNNVAVKVLSKPSTNGQDFINEVATMGRIHHMNVIQLVGYCVDRSKCALVYDFMPNGSLEKYIYIEKPGNSSLSWDRKHEIAVGVARGIEYLHRGCDIQILHFDIKPHNILLDDNFNPKISDFGLAKFYSTEKNIVTLTAARGTIGYVAPELINRSIGGVSYKADVYSFGMLLVDLVGLKRNLAANDENSSQYFPHWIYDRLNKCEDCEIAETDSFDDGNMGRIKRRMTIVALWCIQMSPSDRPSMSKVLEMLETDVESLKIPPQPSESGEQLAQFVEQTWETYSTSDYSALLCDGSTLNQDL
ncbi:putative receptor-like protein kinase-like [Dorcoceras hygrometricum]|uniref:Putative receptor-like protein kinase-like n=1 Tax=Dorcoceras hygrometricum TaxID=472368 RepID=A0A2Z7A6Q2_9LAMI|nr:putative receptor-like protein kinase-like [Dorcoceras hygrometricum]